MSSENFDLFLILLKLKSYLVSLVDSPSGENDSFDFTEEFLERKYPEHKDEILDLLVANKINNDAEIAFDEKIHLKFKAMVSERIPASDLTSILEKFKIHAIQENIKDKTLGEIKGIREQKLKEIVTLLLQLARVWTQRGELENNVEDFSFLEEEELIRPEEQKELGKLDKDTMASFKAISKLTQFYLEQLIDYYFTFGGDIPLADFIKSLDDFKSITDGKYKELFNRSGLK